MITGIFFVKNIFFCTMKLKKQKKVRIKKLKQKASSQTFYGCMQNVIYFEFLFQLVNALNTLKAIKF